MPGRLVAIDGALKGQVFTIGPDLGIGRGPACRLSIPGDPYVSREHCAIREVEGCCQLEDRDSQNGTFVNGIPVRRRDLEHGDHVQVGGSVFLFLLSNSGDGDLAPHYSEDETPLLGTPVAALHERTGETLAGKAPARAIRHEMVGESAAMQRVYEFISKAAPADSTVMLLGETGTGKELAARAIHANSARAASPFVAINCAALTETLLESELFGHERGAFTGAMAQKIGRIERAEGGTFFLDEIGEMRPELQAKLLRVLQERTFERLGGTRSIRLNIRVIAATNRDLLDTVNRSEFRRDLYYRVSAVSLRMPPLRERREDIPLLASYFVAKCRENVKRRIAGVSRQARELLINYDWPGNVRELENTIEYAAVLGSGESILPEDLPESILEFQGAGAPSITQYHEAVQQAKRQLILKALEEAGGDHKQAAERLGLQRTYLHRLIRNLNLRDSTQRGRQTA